MLKKTSFGAYEKYTISSGQLTVSVITLGAACAEILFNDRNITLSRRSAEAYRTDGGCIGVIVGRCANRIAGARFTLNGHEYRLTPNEGENQLHGGPNAFDRRVWQAIPVDDCAVRLCLASADGDNGYPGNLTAFVTYRVKCNCLRIDFEGECDCDTIFAPTTHMYFNLSGAERISNTVLKINAKEYLPADTQLLPLEITPVQGTAFDFTEPRRISRSYDNCFLLQGFPSCVAQDGNLRLTLQTDFPGLQLYTGDGLAGEHHPFQGFALEPEFYPNSPNRLDFPSPILKKGEHFHRYITYTIEQC